MKRLLLLITLTALLVPWAVQAEVLTFDFSNGIPSGWNNSGTYPWVVANVDPDNKSITGIKSGNSGVGSSNSMISATFMFLGDGSITFHAGCWGEGTSTAWDKCIFIIDGTTKFQYGALQAWDTYTYDVEAGEHTFTWNYSKDGSVDKEGDAFFIDNVVVDLGTAGAPVKPTDLVVNDITSNTAILNWTENGSAEEWQICLNNDETSLLTASGHPYTLTGLSPATTYAAKVRAVSGNLQSAWSSTISFTTDCEALSIDADHPFTENFEGCNANTSYTPSDNYLPLCWAYINECTYSSYKWYPLVDSYSSSNAHSGSKYLKFYSYYSSWSDYDPQPQYAILPEMNDLDGKQLVLYACGYNASSSIIIGRMTDPSDASTFSQIAEQTLTATYAEYEFNLAGVNGDYIAIKIDAASSSKSSNGAYIDDIVVREAPSCLKPTELAASNIAPNSVDLNWTANSGELEWKLFYKKAGDENFTEVDNVTDNPYTLENLDPASVYQFYVKAVCGASEESEESAIASFVTGCEAVSALSWSENFDSYEGATSSTAPSGYPNDFLPVCWQFLNRSANTSTFPQVFISSNSGFPVSGNCLFFKSSSTTPLYAILPEFAEDIAGLQLTFTYRNEGVSESNGTLHVGYMTDPADASTFASVLTCPQTTTLTEKEVLFNNAPSGSYIAFKYQGGSYDNYYLSIDNVSVKLAPSCLKPTALMLETPSSRTAHTATLKWTNGEEGQTAWQICLNGDETNLVEANSNPFTVTGLTAETAYTAKVRANCGDSQSDWSNETNFTTLIACPAIGGLNSSEVTSNSVKLSWNEGESGLYDVQYGVVTEATIADYKFDESSLPSGLSTTSSYPWSIDANAHNAGPCAKSGNGGVNSSTSDMVLNVNLVADATLTFSAKISSEASYDKGYFTIDGVAQSNLNGISGAGQWIEYNYNLSAGDHTLRWYYYKDSSTAGNDDCFYVDDIKIDGGDVLVWTIIPDLSNTSQELDGLNPETKYAAQIRANCGSEDGVSEWSNSVTFTTLANCAVPFNLAATEVTAHGATLTWEGNSDSYEISVSKIEFNKTDEYNFEDGQFPAALTHSGTYGFEIVSGKSESGNYCVKSSNGGVNSSTAEMVLEVNLSEDQTLSFLAKISSEASYDKGYFSIDGTVQSGLNAISGAGEWTAYNYNLSAGTHTLRWYYTKDSSGDTNDDCLYVDDIVIGVSSVVPVENYPVSESPYVLNDAAKIDPETTYVVTVKGICGGNPTEASTAVQFTTLPSCLPVSGLAVKNITASSADFSWADNSGQTQWQYACALENATPVWSTENIVDATSANVNGLSATTSYDFYVRAYCGVDDYSEAIKLNFRTECDVVSLPFSCGFENTDDLDCWTLVDCESSTGRYQGGQTYAYEGSWSFKFRYNTNPPQYLISPELEASTNSVKVDFYYKKTSDTYEETFQVGYSTTNKSADSFIWNDEVEAAMTYQRYSAVYPAGVKYVAIKYTANDQLALYIDNFKVHEFVPYVLDINASRYATYYNEDDAYTMPEGLVGHIFNATDKLVQTYVANNVVPAGVPLVLEGNAGNYQLVPTLDAGVAPTGTNDLIGNNEAGIIGSATDGYVYYVLSMNASNEPESVGFYYMLDEGKGGFSMPAHKAYLKYTASSAPARFYLFNGENGATWLENLEGVEGTVKFMHEGNIYILRDSIIYDATGRKVRELK